jgi:hypothetical protein
MNQCRNINIHISENKKQKQHMCTSGDRFTFLGFATFVHGQRRSRVMRLARVQKNLEEVGWGRSMMQLPSMVGEVDDAATVGLVQERHPLTVGWTRLLSQKCGTTVNGGEWGSSHIDGENGVFSGLGSRLLLQQRR